MRKIIIFFLLTIFNININGSATEYGIGNKYLKNPKSITLNKTEEKMLTTLQNALIEAKKSNYEVDKTIYALDAIKFTTQTVNYTILVNLVQPLIIALKGAPTNIIEIIFPIIQKTVQSLLNNTSINSHGDIVMLKELEFALNDTIFKGYPEPNVANVLNQLEKIVEQNNVPQEFLISLSNTVIDVFKSLISLSTGFIFQTSIINDTINLIDATINDIKNRLERLRNNLFSLTNYIGNNSIYFGNYTISRLRKSEFSIMIF